MYYKDSDIQHILDNIKKRYLERPDYRTPFGLNNSQAIEKNVNLYREKLISFIVASKILEDIQNELENVEKPAYDDFSLDVPTQCDNCFAQRANGICWVCAFTGDLSESGFYQKYGIMENCPFLTQKQVDDLAYDFIKNDFEMLHQENVNELDNQLREEIKKQIQEHFEDIWGGKSD